MDQIPITTEGFQKMQEELKHLKTVQRPNIILAIAAAKELGDLSENAEYSSAREQQGLIEGKIASIEDKIARSKVINVKEMSGNQIKFGAKVKILQKDSNQEKTLQIVGEYEANFAEQKISVRSLVGQALIGKEVGEIVEVETPNGTKQYEILSFSYS